MNMTAFNDPSEETTLTLYHGSGRVTKTDDIVFPGSRYNCDFGRGFYLAESKGTAEEWATMNGKPVVNVYKMDVPQSHILRLGAEEWARVVVGFRTKKYKVNFKSPVICGVIADDRMSEALPLFMNGTIGDKRLFMCLDLCKLGDQYLIREHVAGLQFVSSYPLKDFELQTANERFRNRRYDITARLRDIYRKPVEGEKFIEDYLNRGDYFET